MNVAGRFAAGSRPLDDPRSTADSLAQLRAAVRIGNDAQGLQLPLPHPRQQPSDIGNGAASVDSQPARPDQLRISAIGNLILMFLSGQRSGTPGATAQASTRPDVQIAAAALQLRLPPRSTPTMGRPSAGGTGRDTTLDHSSSLTSGCAWVASGALTFILNRRKADAARSDDSASSCSRFNVRTRLGLIAVHGFAARTASQSRQVFSFPWIRLDVLPRTGPRFDEGLPP